MNRKILTFCLANSLIWICACTSSTKSPEEEPIVTVSIEPVRFLVQAIADTLFRVECMVPESNSPETYEPSPSQITGMSRSKAYLRIGSIGFEQVWMERLQAVAPNMKVVDITAGLEYIREHSEHADHTHSDGIDPHVWTSPRNIRLMAHNICETLKRLSPSDSLFFQRKYEALDSLIIGVDFRIRHLLSEEADSTFLIYHPVLSYFARDYGVRQLCVEEHGKEPSPARLRSLIDECRRLGTRVIFVQQQFDTRHAEVIARQMDCRLVRINPLGPNWINELERIATEIAHPQR